MKTLVLASLMFLLNSSALLLFAQTNSGDDIAKRVISSINTGNTKQLKSIQATPDIYRKVAPTQMKGKSDLEVMALVDISGFSIYDKVQIIISSLIDANLDPAKLKYKNTVIEKFEYINADFRIIRLYCKYEEVTDTLVLEGYLLKGKWYLVDLANDDKELNNIISKKGTVSAQKIFDRGLEAMKADNWTDAVKHFENVIQLNPDFREAYYKCGFSYIETGDFKKSSEVLSKGIERFPDYRDLYVELGYVLNKLEKNDEALKVFNKAILLDSSSYWAYFYSGSMLYDQERYEEAVNYYNGAVKYNPSNYYNPYHNRARAYFSLKKYSLAKDDYLKIVEIYPTLSDSYYYLGWIENDFENFESALVYLQKYLEMVPNQLDAVYEKAYANKKLGNFTLAISDFEAVKEVIEMTPSTNISTSRLYKHLADCYYEAGNKEKACIYYQKAESAGDDGARELAKERCK